jgi:hypothetical protein
VLRLTLDGSLTVVNSERLDSVVGAESEAQV